MLSSDVWRACGLSAMVLLLLTYCTPTEEEITTDPSAALTFSTDTVFFDTLFTDTLSFTKRFKVYNPQRNALRISRIELEQGASSFYQLTINGVQSEQFNDQILLGEDSLLVLVTANIPARGEDMPFVVEDRVLFNTNSNQQDVDLVAWGQEANFFRSDSIITCNTTWTADRPYVLYGSVLVDSACTLTLEAGTRVFVNRDATFLVAGTLITNGSVEAPVEVTDLRLDLEAPGQWVGILFLVGSKNNLLQHTHISNAEFGVRIGTPDNDTLPDLTIGNSIIQNMSTFGILSFTSDVWVYNSLIDNCIDFSVAHFAGGFARYQHCTITNFSVDQFSQQPAAIFTDNLVLEDDTQLVEDLYLRLQNSVIWGTDQESNELIFNLDGGANADLLIQNSLLRTDNEIFNINGNVLNTDPLFPAFVDPFDLDFQLDTLSPAKDLGIPIGITVDILGNPRDATPDAGAYERIE